MKTGEVIKCYKIGMKFSLTTTIFALVLASAGLAQSHGDLHNTVTIFVGGFNPDGSSQQGVLGEDVPDSLLDEIADMMGVSSMADPGGLVAPDLITMAEYYGDIPPSWWTTQDQIDLDAVVAQFGGGVPAYALIQAKFARHVLDRTGADHMNLLGASFGGLISRYLVRHDLENLVSDGHLIRWQILEGASNGSWVASDPGMQFLWGLFGTPTIDVDHLQDAWVDQHLDSPHNHLGHSNYGEMLIGPTASTDDGANGGALSTALFLAGSGWAINDGVLLENDGMFRSWNSLAMSRGRAPASSWHPVDHYSLADYLGARPNMAAFCGGSRRFTLTIVGAQFHKLEEGGLFTLMPAEVAFDLSVRSKISEQKWGITDPISERATNNYSSPLFDVHQKNQWQSLNINIFDDMVLNDESELQIDTAAWEFDWEEHYDMWELFGSNKKLGAIGGNVLIANGSYTLTGNAYDLKIEARVHEYPFGRSIWLDGHDTIATAQLPLSGQEQVVQIDFGPAMAGNSYRVYGGMTGAGNGLDIGNGIVLPINSDAYTGYVDSTMNTALHFNYSGTLDSRGRATAVFNQGGAPLPSAALGKSLRWAVGCFDFNGDALAGSLATIVKIN